MRFTIKVFIFSQILCIGSLHFGFGIGFPSPTLSELKKLGLLDDNTYQTYTSLFVVGLAFGSLIAAPGSKYLGRKLVCILSSLSNTLGLLLIAGASNPGYLLAGRLFHGIGAGSILTIIPLYTGEITPPASRGFLSSFLGVYIALGSFLVYLFGIFLSFRLLAIIGISLSLLQVIALLIVPESPAWLHSRGLEKRAKCVLERLRGNKEEALEECSALKSALNTKSYNSTMYYFKVILVGYRLKALCVGILLAVGIINTGIDIVYSYASPLLENKGFDPTVIALGSPILGLIGSVVAIFLVEPLGRKPLLFSSSVIVTGSLLSITLYFLIDEHIFRCSQTTIFINDEICNWIIIWPGVSLAVFNFGYQIGWGSIMYVIIGELFPIRIKEFASGILRFIMNLHAISTLTAFPYIASAIGNGYSFLILFVANILPCVFIILFLPETKKLKADEIEEIFQEKSILCGLNCASQTYILEDK